MPPDRVAASALRAEASRRFLCDGATAERLTPIRHILLSCRETYPDGARRESRMFGQPGKSRARKVDLS